MKSIKISLLSIFLITVVAQAAAFLLKEGLYKPADESWPDSRVKITATEGKITGLVETVDPDGDSYDVTYKCEENACKSEEGDLVTILSETQYKYEYDGDTSIYTYQMDR